MSMIHEQPATNTDTITPAPRSPGHGEFSTDQSDVPFGIPTPRDDEDFEPTIIRGRE